MMKTLVRTLLIFSAFTCAALAFESDYKTRIITSATLTIHVKDGQFITIRNFTQDQDTGQRGILTAGIPAPSPTPTPTPPAPTPSPTPGSTDLIATKSHTPAGNVTFPNAWTWTIHVANRGNTPATFALLDTILTDNLPNNNITYPQGSVPVANPVNITNSNAINCAISSADLTCFANGSVTVGAGGSFDISFTATPGAAGSYVNPRTGGGCSVDPNNVIAESDETNNTCADTVVSNTSAQISGVVLTASISHTDATLLAEYVKPVIIAGPATLTIEPVPGAKLAITYKKFLQPIQPSPTATVSSSSTSITSSAMTTLSSGTSTRSATVIESGTSDEEGIEWSTPSRTGTPSPTPTATPTARPNASGASPTPTPTIIPSPTPTP